MDRILYGSVYVNFLFFPGATSSLTFLGTVRRWLDLPFLRQSLRVLRERIRYVMPGRLCARPEVALWFHVRVIIQRAGPDEDHPRSMFRTQVYAATAGSAEEAMFSRR